SPLPVPQMLGHAAGQLGPAVLQRKIQRRRAASRVVQLKASDQAGDGGGDAGVDQLLAWMPTDVGGAQGTAAWLITAHDLGFLDGFDKTLAQLQDFADGKSTVHSEENEHGDWEKKVMAGQGGKTHKPKGVSRTGRGSYEIEAKDAPILAVMVD